LVAGTNALPSGGTNYTYATANGNQAVTNVQPVTTTGNGATLSCSAKTTTEVTFKDGTKSTVTAYCTCTFTLQDVGNTLNSVLGAIEQGLNYIGNVIITGLQACEQIAESIGSWIGSLFQADGNPNGDDGLKANTDMTYGSNSHAHSFGWSSDGASFTLHH